MPIIIPEWFYGFDPVMYFISAMVGFLLSFYFYRLYPMTLDKKHLYFHLGFLLLSVGFLIISITNALSYTVYWHCIQTRANCVLDIIDEVFAWDDFAYLIYFGLSISAYLLFARAYAGEYAKLSKIFAIALSGYVLIIATLLPVRESMGRWYYYNGYFHLAALIILIFISFRNFANYLETKNYNSLLVALSFSFISVFHLFHILSFISGWMYVLSHVFMLAGFAALWVMVARIGKT